MDLDRREALVQGDSGLFLHLFEFVIFSLEMVNEVGAGGLEVSEESLRLPGRPATNFNVIVGVVVVSNL